MESERIGTSRHIKLCRSALAFVGKLCQKEGRLRIPAIISLSPPSPGNSVDVRGVRAGESDTELLFEAGFVVVVLLKFSIFCAQMSPVDAKNRLSHVKLSGSSASCASGKSKPLNNNKLHHLHHDLRAIVPALYLRVSTFQLIAYAHTTSHAA